MILINTFCARPLDSDDWSWGDWGNVSVRIVLVSGIEDLISQWCRCITRKPCAGHATSSEECGSCAVLVTRAPFGTTPPLKEKITFYWPSTFQLEVVRLTLIITSNRVWAPSRVTIPATANIPRGTIQHFLTERNTKEIWREVVLIYRPPVLVWQNIILWRGHCFDIIFLRRNL